MRSLYLVEQNSSAIFARTTMRGDRTKSIGATGESVIGRSSNGFETKARRCPTVSPSPGHKLGNDTLYRKYDTNYSIIIQELMILLLYLYIFGEYCLTVLSSYFAPSAFPALLKKLSNRSKPTSLMASWSREIDFPRKKNSPSNSV